MSERKIVAPAHPDAKIPDLDHHRFLPPEGMEVAWSPYWERHLRQGNVTVSDVPSAAGAPAPRPAPPAMAPSAEPEKPKA
jgi:hypothetical protein